MGLHVPAIFMRVSIPVKSIIGIDIIPGRSRGRVVIANENMIVI